MKKIAEEVVAFFAIIVNGIGRFLLAILKIIWFPFSVIARAIATAVVAIARTIVAGLKAIGRGIAAACRGIYKFCTTKPIATIILFALGWLTLLGFVLPTLYIWDASFYSRQASPVLPILTYIAVGLTFRTVVVIGPSFFIRSVTRGEWMAAIVWFFLSAISLPACILAAMGAVTEGQDYHFRKSSAIETTSNTSVESFDAQIGRIEGEKERERLETEKLIAGARASITEVTTDGNPNNDDLSSFEASIRQYTLDGANTQAGLNDQIKVLEAAKLTAQTTATDEKVIQPPIAAVYQFPARYTTAVEPMAFRDASAVYWVFGLEIIGFLLPGTLYAAHLVAAHRVPVQKQPKIRAAKPRRRFRWAFWNWIGDKVLVKAPDDPDPVTGPTPAELARKKLEDEEQELQAALSNAELEKRLAELRQKLEEARKPPEPKPSLTPEQQRAQNAGLASSFANDIKGNVVKIPVGAWSNRPDRIEQVRAAQ